MAKQAVNALERHVEKGVLGVCALLLFASVGFYLVRSPNTVEVGGQVAGPGEADEFLRDAATALRGRARAAEPDTEFPEDPLPEIQKGAAPLEYARVARSWASPVPIMPRVPDIGPVIIGDKIQLVKVVPTTKPRCMAGRSTVDLLPAVEFGESAEGFEEDVGIFYEPINWITVSAVFDRREQARQCQLMGYEPARRQAYISGIELQRRRQRSDGTWPQEWDEVLHYAAEYPPYPPEISLKEVGGQAVADDRSWATVRSYFDTIKNYQIDIIRPVFSEVINGDRWTLPEIEDHSIRNLDAEFLDPDNLEHVEDIDDRYGLEEEEEQEEEETRPARVVEKEKLDEIRQLRDAGELDGALARAHYLEAVATITTNRRAAKELVEEIKQLISDRKRKELRNPKRDEEEEDEGVRPISPVQVVWAHDCDIGSVASGATYQYRMRAQLYNRYASAPRTLKDSADAQKALLTGPWSEPSDPVVIPDDTRFFVTSGGGNRAGVRLHVFKWFEGYWVESKTSVSVGDRIGKVSRVKIPTPEGGVEKPKVSFYTGGTVVDIDYDRPMRTRSKKGRGGAFDFDSLGSTVALVYVDARGTLHERLLASDRSNPDYKKMKELLWVPPQVARRSRDTGPPPLGGGGGMGAGGGQAGGGRGGRGDGTGRGGRRGGGRRGGGGGGGRSGGGI